MIENSVGGGENDIAELPGWEKLGLPVFEFLELDIEPWADGNTLVEPSEKIDNDLAASVVIDNFEFADVTTVHHNLEELNDNLASWANKNLPLAPAFCVGDSLESVSEN